MNNFEFGRAVKICGKEYHITSDMKSVTTAMTETSMKLNELSSSDLSDDEITKLITQHYRHAIDATLGEGSFDQIFEGRVINYTDLFELIRFITREIEIWREEQKQNAPRKKIESLQGRKVSQIPKKKSGHRKK